jgi:hypothetical protein
MDDSTQKFLELAAKSLYNQMPENVTQGQVTFKNNDGKFITVIVKVTTEE